MKTSIYIFILISFVFSQEIRINGDTIKFLDSLRYSNNLKLLYDEETFLFKYEQTKECYGTCFEFYTRYDDSLVGTVKKAFFPIDKDSLFLSTIPGTPYTNYFREDRIAFISKKIDEDKFNRYCVTVKKLPKELKQILNHFFEKDYYSLYVGDSLSYRYIRKKNNQQKDFTIPSSNVYWKNLGSFGNDYSKLYFLTQKFLFHLDSNCTWKNVLKNGEKL